MKYKVELYKGNSWSARNIVSSICLSCNNDCCRNHTRVYERGAFPHIPNYIPKQQETSWINNLQRKTNRTNKCDYWRGKWGIKR